MNNLKGRIISILVVTAMIATGTVPRSFAEMLNESSALEQTSTVAELDEQTTNEDPVYITGENEDLRTEYSKTYEQSDGSCVAVVSAEPVHFYDNKEELWKEYDNRLSYDEETDTYESNENGSDMMVSLPKNIDEQNNIEVEADGYKVSITPIDVKSSSSKGTNDKKIIKSNKFKDLKKYDLEDYVSDSVLDGKVEYTQDDDTSIKYIFSGSKLKENIVLSKTPEKKQDYSFRIKADGLTAKLKKDNSVKLLDNDKKAVFNIPAPYMYDEEYEFSDDIKTSLKKNGSEYILTYTPNYKWLSDEERKYPVTIDPTITSAPYTNKIIDTSVFSASTYDFSSNPNLYVGAQSNRACVMDAYINFTDLPEMDKLWTISNAKLNLKTATNKDNKINAKKVTSAWETSTIKSNPPTANSTILDVCDVPATANTWVYWDITNTVFDWYNGENNYGIKLTSPSAQNNQSIFYSADTSNSSDRPYLSIEYKTASGTQLENSRNLDVRRAGTVTINDFTGNIVLSRKDIGVDGNVMPVNISMVYNLNYINSTLFGYGFKTNYSQMLIFKKDTSKNEYYEYYCGDGSLVYFDYDEKTGEYIDRSDRGYAIEVNSVNKTKYENVVIIDSSKNKYYFDQYGRLIKIVSDQGTAKPSINIAYNGDNTKLFEIDYITDGFGRKYDFNYSNGKLTDISYYGKSSTVLRKVSYEYDSYSNLSKVTYPDGKSVSYRWNNHNLVAIFNTDDYHICFTHTNYHLNKRRRISSIKEYGIDGALGADISVSYTPYQTKYTNNISGNTETLVFSSNGDLISTYNSKGEVTANEYAKESGVHGVSSLVKIYEHKKSETNMIQNGEFKDGLTGWNYGDDTNVSLDSIGHPGNNKSVKLSGTPGKSSTVMQGIPGTGKKGDTYNIGGWARGNASPQHPFNITVTFFNANKTVGQHKIDFNPYCTYWQYVMKTIEADANYTHFFVTIDYSNQINSAYFDGIVMYKGERVEDENNTDTGTDNDTDTDEEAYEPTTSTGSDGSITTIDESDGVRTITVDDKYGNNLSNATVVNGITMSDSNEYSSSGNYMKSSTASSGIKTSYTYNENTGNLSTVNVHNNPINYGYDTMGNITSVSQNVSGLSNGTAITNSYSYDSGDRLSKITHNGFNYNFAYTEFGLLKSIKAGSQSLINYGYDSEGILSSASYGNGQSIDYDYNDDKNKMTVKQDGSTLYSYKYDEYGTLTSVKDNDSGRVTNYLTNDEGQDIIEETGDGVYHKYYQTENRKIETIGDKTKSTDTTINDSSTVITYNVSYNGGTTHEKNTDKFDRITNEKVVVHGKAGAMSEVYNKEYIYRTSSNGNTTDNVSKISYSGAYDKTIEYKYDECGNISEIDGIEYVYNEAGQLTSEYNEIGRISRKYVYDKGGNITELKRYENGKLAHISTYTYGNSIWKDLLTAYNGNEITYDEIGNPLTYYNGMEFSWTMGRRLESVKNGNTNIGYTYNVDGLRTSKTVNNVKYNYYWNGDKLTAQTWQGNTMYFYYDNDGKPIGFDYNDDHYYYITNLQGDIIAILGGGLTEYKYDAWGNCTIVSNTNSIAEINPLRYRGYYYDSDTNLYYLQSRYYDAKIGRFINADAPEMIKIDVTNLYCYCDNNPINSSDHSGSWCYNIKYCAFNDRIRAQMMNRYNNNKKAMNNYYKSMIYAQHNEPITNMKYLDSNLSNVGCEIIAVYNSMKRMNKKVFLAGVILEFEMNGLYYVRSGKLGSDPYSLGSYFKAHKVKYNSYLTRKNLIKNAKSGKKCGIISFWNNNGKLFFKEGIHTVAYWYDSKTKCFYLPNYYCNLTKPSKFTEKEFNDMINSKNNFIIGYTFK